VLPNSIHNVFPPTGSISILITGNVTEVNIAL
jgi:hypothetical protein